MKRFALLCLVIIALSTAARFSSSQTALAEGPPPDPRLAARVSLEMPEATLADLLKEISDKSGIKHHPDPAKTAWHVQERKLCVFAKDLPLSTLQSLLRKLLGYSWKTEGTPGSPEFVIYQSEVDKAREDKERREKAQKAAAKWSSDWKWTTAVCRRLLSMRPDQRGKLVDWKEIDSAKAGYLSAIPDQMLDRLVSGEGVRMRYDDMPPRLKSAVRKLAWEESHLLEDFLTGTTVHMQFTKPQANRPFTAIGWGLTVFSRKEGVVDIANINCHLAPIPDSATAALMQEGFIPAGAWKFPTEADAIKEGVPQKYSDSKPPKEPKLLAPIRGKLEKNPTDIPELLKQLSHACGMPVLCDVFDGSPLRMAEMPQLDLGQPLYKVLNTAARAIRRVWSYEDGAILFKDPDWFDKRSWDVPQVWKDYLKARLVEGMTFDDLVAMAGFSDGQLDFTLNADKDIGPVIPGDRAMLRFYRSLSDSQKKRIWGPNGLAPSSLSVAQRQLLSKMLEDNNSDLDPAQPGILRMSRTSRTRDSDPNDPREYVTLEYKGFDGTSATYSTMLPPATRKKPAESLTKQP